jgi:predicted nucleic acid-binding Zn ribbon protein
VARAIGAPPASTLTAVFAGWNDIVGDAVAAHARPVSLVRGVLRVAVDQPAWATELRFIGPQLLQRCAEVTGDDSVVRLEVRVDR